MANLHAIHACVGFTRCEHCVGDYTPLIQVSRNEICSLISIFHPTLNQDKVWMHSPGKKKKRQHFGLKIFKNLQCNFSTNSNGAWFEFGEWMCVCVCVCVCVCTALIIHIHCELMTVIVCSLISTLAQKGILGAAKWTTSSESAPTSASHPAPLTITHFPPAESVLPWLLTASLLSLLHLHLRSSRQQ